LSESLVNVSLPPEWIDAIAMRVADILERRMTARVEPEAKGWLTVAEAAAYIGAKPQRIYDLRSSGRIRRHGDGGRALVDRDELDDLITEGRSIRSTVSPPWSERRKDS
jgi:excisionase family DNA binding protein